MSARVLALRKQTEPMGERIISPHQEPQSMISNVEWFKQKTEGGSQASARAKSRRSPTPQIDQSMANSRASNSNANLAQPIMP